MAIHVCVCVCAGTASSCSLWQRISVMQVMRRLCADAYFLHFLYVTYDAKEVQTPSALLYAHVQLYVHTQHVSPVFDMCYGSIWKHQFLVLCP